MQFVYLISFLQASIFMGYLEFETERLILKPTSESDSELVLHLFNTPKWIRYIGDRNIRNHNDAVAYIKERMITQLERLGFSNYTLIKKEDGIKIGICGLFDRDGLQGIDLGFALLPQHEGKGFAYEASVGVMDAAFNEFGLKQLCAITSKDNVASQQLLVKLGFEQTRITQLPGDEEELLFYEIAEKSRR